MLDGGEHAPPGGSARAAAAARGVLDDGESAPPGGSAGMTATGVRNDGVRAGGATEAGGCSDGLAR